MSVSLKTLEMWGRRTAAAMLRGGVSDRDGALPGEPSMILVIRTDSRLGNLVLMEPLLRSIRERFPNAGLVVLASHVFAGLLTSQGYNVMAVDKKGQISKPWRFLRLMTDLREELFDVAIDAGHPHSFSLSGAVSTLLSGAPCRISTDAGDSPGWYTMTAPEPPLGWHESRALHSLGSLWEGWPPWSPPRLSAPGRRGRNAVGLHVGASGRKEYPVDKLEELAGRLCGRLNLELYWGSGHERETALGLGEKLPVRVMPRLAIPQLLDRLSGLRMFVTADNGPMHAASALSVPVTALFRVDNSDRFAPLSPGSKVLFHEDGPDPETAAEMVLQALGCY